MAQQQQREVIVNEPLCFLTNNIVKLTVSQLKPILISFYNDEELCESKDILYRSVTSIVDSGTIDMEVPRLPRRQGDNKHRQVADDLLKLLTIVDEHKALHILPSYVAANLLRIPFVNADSMNAVMMSKKLEIMEQRLTTVEQLMTQSMSITAEVKAPTNLTDEVTVADPVDASAWKESSPVDCSDTDDADRGVWESQARRRKKSKSGGHVVKQANKSGTQESDKKIVIQNKKKVFGTLKSSSDAVLKSGVSIIQKAVIHVDNLDIDCTEALLTDYLLANDVQVLSCYKAKSWLRSDDERSQVTAFRVCIPATHRHMVFNSDLWSTSVIIRDWKFKKTQNGGQS